MEEAKNVKDGEMVPNVDTWSPDTVVGDDAGGAEQENVWSETEGEGQASPFGPMLPGMGKDEAD